MMFMLNSWERILTPHQAALLMIQSYPWSPDSLSIANCYAEEAGDPTAAELLAMGYHAAVGLPRRDEKPSGLGLRA